MDGPLERASFWAGKRTGVVPVALYQCPDCGVRWWQDDTGYRWECFRCQHWKERPEHRKPWIQPQLTPVRQLQLWEVGVPNS